MLKISNLSFSYNSEVVLSQVSLVFDSPDIVAIIGDNGSGKTTLLRLIAGELVPDDGTISHTSSIGFLHQSNDGLNNKSGGERTRIKLAELFRNRPSILLLDEPTNNLDESARAWLTENLLSYDGLAIIASHDRDFIDSVVTELVEIKDGTATLYSGNYGTLELRQQQLDIEQQRRYDRTNQRRKKLRANIIKARHNSQAVGIRTFDKRHDEGRMALRGKKERAQKAASKVIKNAESKLAQLDTINKPYARKSYQAHLPAGFLRPRQLLSVDNLSMDYGDRILFDGLSFAIQTGERWQILGNNGAGKSTLLRIIMGEIEPRQGSIRQAPHLSIGYVAQDKLQLNPEQSFIEQANIDDITEIYKAASTMDFTPADMRAPIEHLSRGRMTKLAILQMILQPRDLLILDEITNHLDIRARQNIEHALAEYPGAILLVSHDQRFVDNLTIQYNIQLRSSESA